MNEDEQRAADLAVGTELREQQAADAPGEVVAEQVIERTATTVRVAQETTRSHRLYEVEFSDGKRSWRRPLWSVTTLLDALDKPGLQYWAANETAAAAIRDRAHLQADVERYGEEGARKRLAESRFATRDKAGDVGEYVHRLIEAHVKGSTPPPPMDDLRPQDVERARAHLARFREWEAEYRPSYVASEATVYHPAHGWAGTLDAIVELGHRGLGVVDVKNTNPGGRRKNEPGVYREHALQVAAYAHAESVIPTRGAWLAPVPMPVISWGAVLWLHADYPPAFVEVDVTDETYDVFRYAAQLYRWTDGPGKRAVRGPQPPSVFGVLPTPEQVAEHVQNERQLRVISEAQRVRFYSIGKGLTHDEVKAVVCRVAGVKSTKDVPRTAYDDACRAVELAAAERAAAPAEVTL